MVMGMRRITAKKFLALYQRDGVRRFKDIAVSNQSFRGEDLSGIEISDSQINGCDFQGTNLTNSRFINTTFGVSFRQHFLILVYESIRPNDIPFSNREFLFSLIYPVFWIYGISIFLFLIISQFIIKIPSSIFAEFLSGKTNFIDFIAWIGVILAIPSIIFAVLFFNIRGLLINYKARKEKSICNNFKKSNLENSSFSKAIIKNCDFNSAKLVNVSIRDSDLQYSSFWDSNIKGLSLRGSSLSNNRFSLSEKILDLMTTLNGKQEDYRDLDLSSLNLSEVNLYGADLSGSRLISSNFENANLEAAILERCDARNINLTGANLNHAVLFAIDLSAANLSSSTLNHCNLAASRIMGANFSGADLTGACISDWQISGTKFNRVQCAYIFLEYSYLSKEFRTRVPSEEGEYLKNNEFEENISQIYEVMAKVLQFGPQYVDEIKKELIFIEQDFQGDQEFQDSIDRLKTLIDAFEQQIGDASRSSYNINIGQVLTSLFGGIENMSGEINKKTTGGMSNDNIIQSDIIQGSSRIHQSSSSSSSSLDAASIGQIIDALNQILKSVSESSIPENQKEEIQPYIEAAKKEAEKDKPKKERIAQNLDWFKDSMESLNTATESTQSLITKLKEPCKLLAKALGLAFSFFP